METTAYTSDNIITRSYEEYHQVILNYITYRIAHRYEAEDLTQDVICASDGLQTDAPSGYSKILPFYDRTQFSDRLYPSLL